MRSRDKEKREKRTNGIEIDNISMSHIHNYEVIILGMNIRQTRTKKHCMVGGRRAVARSVWVEEYTDAHIFV